MKIYFTDFFNISEDYLDGYGAFNVALINDLPLFIDPFLIFGSNKNQYKALHQQILKYLRFLKRKAEEGYNESPQIKSWYIFPEVKQNWFGYSKVGNKGTGLGMKFGQSMSSTMHLVFKDLDHETITKSSHLEKACLFETGVGRDNISDFTTNLIKDYLLDYTQIFARKHLKSVQLQNIKVDKVYFDYTLERWMPKIYTLPFYDESYVILTPKDLLTKDENWINGGDLRANFKNICNSIPNEQLRNEINNYFYKVLPTTQKKKRNTQNEVSLATQKTILKFPQIIDWYIKDKEENTDKAKSISSEKVAEVEQIFIKNIREFVDLLSGQTDFYKITQTHAIDEAHKRVLFLKQVIEENDGYRLFYLNGKPIKREDDLQIIYRLTWFASEYDINREVNNGRGPVDYSISKGSKNKSLVEFKLASNSKLKQNLAKQVDIYKKANKTLFALKVILFFDTGEFLKVNKILKELMLDNDPNIILIDGSRKESASNVKI